MPFPKVYQQLEDAKGDVRLRLKSGSDLVVFPRGLTFNNDGWPAYEVEIVRGDPEHPKGRKIVFIHSEIESAEELEPTGE